MDKSILLKKAIYILIFFSFTPITIFATSFSLLLMNKDSEKYNQIEAQHLQEKTSVLSPLNPNSPEISVKIIPADARPEIVKRFFKKYNSPLQNFAQNIVDAADKYDLDWRILPAIAIKESGGCRVIPQESYNCWGWGIHSKGTLKFNSYEEAIEKVSSGIRQEYLSKGFVSIEQIMKKYAHPASTTWAEDVLGYMSQMQ